MPPLGTTGAGTGGAVDGSGTGGAVDGFSNGTGNGENVGKTLGQLGK